LLLLLLLVRSVSKNLARKMAEEGGQLAEPAAPAEPAPATAAIVVEAAAATPTTTTEAAAATTATITATPPAETAPATTATAEAAPATAATTTATPPAETVVDASPVAEAAPATTTTIITAATAAAAPAVVAALIVAPAPAEAAAAAAEGALAAKAAPAPEDDFARLDRDGSGTLDVRELEPLEAERHYVLEAMEGLIDLADKVQLQVEEVRPSTAPSAGTPRKVRPHSLLGLSLGRPDLAPPLSAIDPSSTAGSETTTLALTQRLPTVCVNSDLTKRISRRYKAEVTEAEKQRLGLFVPLHQRVTMLPDEREMARTVKGDLDAALKKAGVEAVGWDALMGADDMQKRMQFLSSHATTGISVEEYGADGRYEGEFLYGLRHGQGKHQFKNEVYEGEWKWDRRHGHGALTQRDGSKISGNWKAGKPDGFASIHDATGATTYEGEFKDGKRQGLGRQIFLNGDSYEGGWQNGLIHDRGVYYYANGDRLIGMWCEGRYDGPSMLHFKDGSISRRVYRHGVLLSSQDYELSMQKFGKPLTRDVMQMHTSDWEYPKHSLD